MTHLLERSCTDAEGDETARPWRPRTRTDLADVARKVEPHPAAVVLWSEWLLWPLGIRSPRVAAFVLWLATTTVIAAATAAARLIL